MTKALIEALAKEAEAGYDPKTLRPRLVGRPSLGSGISPPVHVRFNREAHAELKRAARATNQTLSAYVRAIVEERLALSRKSRHKKAAS